MAPTRTNYDRLAEEALRITADIIEAYGPRVSGTAGNGGARSALKALLGESCTDIREDRFDIHPNSLFAIGKVFAAAYLIGLLALLLSNVVSLLVGFAVMAICLAYFLAQFILYRDSFDRCFAKADAGNIIGTIAPKSRPDRQVVVVRHHDSAPIYSFYEKAPQLFAIRLLLAVIAFFFCFVCTAISLVSIFSSNAGGTSPIRERSVAVLGALLALPMFGYMSKRGSPGAGDDLIACAIGIKLAELFHDGPLHLARTRVIVLLTDGEEVGQKGAKSFIESNAALLHELDTTVINLDSIYEYEDLVLLRRDRNGLSELSMDLANEIRKTAAGLGHDISIASIPFLGGGTDAGQFARRGLRTASIIAQPIKAFSKEIIFHTDKDRPDRISSRAVAAVIEIVAAYIRAVDGSLITPSH